MSSSPPALAELAPGLSAAGGLDRSDIEALASAGVQTIINNRPDGEVYGQLPADEARRIAEAHGIAYHHIPVTATSLSSADVDAFAAVLATAPAPIVAHCRSGTRGAPRHRHRGIAGDRRPPRVRDSGRQACPGYSSSRWRRTSRTSHSPSRVSTASTLLR